MSDPSSQPVAFISHANADAAKAHELARHLEGAGVPCWIAPRDVVPGRNFGDEIIRGIETCRAFVLVLSSASNKSDFVAKELASAVSKKRTIYPVRIEDVGPADALALFIAGTHWIDAFTGKLPAHAQRLAALLGSPQTATPPRPVAALPSHSQPPRGRWRTVAALAAALALIAYFYASPSNQQAQNNQRPIDPVVIDPNNLPEKEPLWAQDGAPSSTQSAERTPEPSTQGFPLATGDPPPGGGRGM